MVHLLPSIVPRIRVPVNLVSAMLTPGILILASGSLISSTLIRLARVVDRARMLMGEIEQMREAENVVAVKIRLRWLSHYGKRVMIVEQALRAYYIAIFLFVASTLAFAVDDVLSGMIAWLAPAIVVAGTFGLCVGTLALVVEATIASGSIREEMAAVISTGQHHVDMLPMLAAGTERSASSAAGS